MKYYYSLDKNSEVFKSEEYTTIEECIEGAKKERDDETTVQIGMYENYFIPYLNVSDTMDYLREQLYDNVGEIGESWLEDVPEEQEEELQSMLNLALDEWFTKYNFNPKFNIFDKIIEYNFITGEEKVIYN